MKPATRTDVPGPPSTIPLVANKYSYPARQAGAPMFFGFAGGGTLLNVLKRIQLQREGLT